MHLLMLLAGWLFVSFAHAQLPPGDLAGIYALQTQQGQVVVRIEVTGGRLAGTLDVPGSSTIALRGNALGRYARGTISSPVDTGEFEALVEGDTLALTLSKKAQTVPLRLKRVDASTAAAPPGKVPAPSPGPPVQGGAGDVRLVGTWVGQSLITSGDASMASEDFLVLRADGSYAYGKGRAVAGGSGWSFEGGGGGATEQGRWRAEDGVYYILGQNGQWKRVGRYGMTEDGQTMRIIYDAGEKAVEPPPVATDPTLRPPGRACLAHLALGPTRTAGHGRRPPGCRAARRPGGWGGRSTSLLAVAAAGVLGGVGLAILTFPVNAQGPPPEGPPNEIVVHVTDLPKGALHEFDFWSDPVSPGGRLVGTPNTGDELDPPPEDDPHVRFRIRVHRSVPYRCWIHMKVGQPKGVSRANLLYVQFTNAVDNAGREVFKPGTGSYLAAQGPMREGWTWVGCDRADPKSPGPLVHFRASGEVSVRIQAGMEGVGFDQVVLSPARFLDAPPSEAVVAKPAR